MSADELRVGSGFDVHPLRRGRRLVLGGVEIPSEFGLDGHSDADVLLHAISDALLGAASLGDLGCQFPDSDAAFKGISSLELLSRVSLMIQQKGFRIVNIDSTVAAEAPRLSPFYSSMRSTIAEALEVGEARIGIKSTTTEKLGFTGRGEGIAAMAVCLLSVAGQKGNS